MLKSYEINKLLVLGFTWKPTVILSIFFFQNQQVQAFLGECLSGPRPIIPSSSNSPISTISQRPVQSLCPTNRAKMIGLDCPCPTEMLYPQKNNPATEYCLIFIPLREASFSRKVMICLKIDDAFWFKVTECEFFWGLFFFFFVLVPYISFFFFLSFFKTLLSGLSHCDQLVSQALS